MFQHTAQTIRRYFWFFFRTGIILARFHMPKVLLLVTLLIKASASGIEMISAHSLKAKRDNSPGPASLLPLIFRTCLCTMLDSVIHGKIGLQNSGIGAKWATEVQSAFRCSKLTLFFWSQPAYLESVVLHILRKSKLPKIVLTYNLCRLFRPILTTARVLSQIFLHVQLLTIWQ